MRKIILLSPTPATAFRRQRLLRSQLKNCDITACCNEKEAMWIILSEQFDLGVFDIGRLVPGGSHFGELVRASEFQFPMIVSGRTEKHEDFFRELPKRANMIFLREPLGNEELVGVARKLLHAGMANQPRERRYVTNERVVVEKYGSNLRLPSLLKNVSLGGAQLEFIEKPSQELRIGDFLRLNFDLNEIGSKRKVVGQVVWVRDDGFQQTRVGLAFLK